MSIVKYSSIFLASKILLNEGIVVLFGEDPIVIDIVNRIRQGEVAGVPLHGRDDPDTEVPRQPSDRDVRGLRRLNKNRSTPRKLLMFV